MWLRLFAGHDLSEDPLDRDAMLCVRARTHTHTHAHTHTHNCTCTLVHSYPRTAGTGASTGEAGSSGLGQQPSHNQQQEAGSSLAAKPAAAAAAAAASAQAAENTSKPCPICLDGAWCMCI